MTDKIHDVRFPGESDAYRVARNRLLEAELELRQRIEEIGTLRQDLPLGGELPRDYVFEEDDGAGGARNVRLSELFGNGKSSLVVYSYMYGRDVDAPCPMCTSMLDSLDGQAPHIIQRANLAVVAKSPLSRLREWQRRRGWSNLRLLSSAGNTFNTDYFAEDEKGHQLPACNVFVRRGAKIHHFYSTELLYAPVEGQPRHVDLIWPLWNVLDMTPEGRGRDWYPGLEYP